MARKKGRNPATNIVEPTPNKCVPAYGSDRRVYANGKVIGIGANTLKYVYGYIFQEQFPGGASEAPELWPSGATNGRISGSDWYFDSSASADRRIPGARGSCLYDYLAVWAVVDSGKKAAVPPSLQIFDPAHVNFYAYDASSGSGICSKLVSLPIFQVAPRFCRLNIDEVTRIRRLSKVERSKRAALLACSKTILTHDEHSPAGIPTWRKFGTTDEWTVAATTHEGKLVGVAVWRPPAPVKSPQIVWDKPSPSSASWDFTKNNRLDLQGKSPRWAQGLQVVVGPA